ncbi:hypothetical protein Poli38472_010155 [Pythium oligandrum]|uniref:Non-specific serine/threonine protein kinase n=1 Tax=Pythium oligandrum TaxID=41045 RepID=A0A8K1C8F9_PYTOL|nr:hypothetical protein Poli38472_010155 [Pythium oligandrum]|eukprot:TMW58596.1 hypothetical protein Poli38472_010155 [Pythium oligandrum]
MKPLHDAVQSRQLEAVRAVLSANTVDVDARDEFLGLVPLHLAAQNNDVEAANLLLNHGAAVDATTSMDVRTSLHLAAERNNTEVMTVLINHGAAIDAASQDGNTPLHVAAMYDRFAAVTALVNRNASIQAVDEDGFTPLHYAARSKRQNVALLLLRRGVAVNPTTKRGQTPLHEAAACGQVDNARVLVEYGAELNRRDEDKFTPLMCLLQAKLTPRQVEEDLELARFLVDAGSEWTPEDEEKTLSSARDIEVTKRLVAAIQGWKQQQEKGARPLLSLPIEIYNGGDQAIRAYFDATESDAGANIPALLTKEVYRRKLCVIGSSGCGKTRFHLRLTNQVTTQKGNKGPTTGVALSSWQFQDKGRQYDVAVWDFAGREEYQAVHPLFYSKQALYVVCVDLKSYSDALDDVGVVTAGAKHPAMDAFVETNVYRWIEEVCTRLPGSLFLLVGVKADLIEHSHERLHFIQGDLHARLRRKERHVMKELIQIASTLKTNLKESDSNISLRQKLLQVEKLQHERPRFLSEKLLSMSSTTLRGLEDVQEMVQRCIVESEKTILLPKTYNRVREFIQAYLQGESEGLSLASRVRRAFVPLDDLRLMIDRELPDISSLGLPAILCVLHELGELLWFDNAGEALGSIVFLDPSLLINFLRQVINPAFVDELSFPAAQHLRNLYDFVRKEARMKHTLLTELPIWKEISDDVVILQLKQLLFQFHLASPFGRRGMQLDSDLLIPTYWGKRGRKRTGSTFLDANSGEFKVRVVWEYKFHRHLPSNLFEKLAVQSYSSQFSHDRVWIGDAFETRVRGHYAACIRKKRSENTENGFEWSGLEFEIHAATQDLAWLQLMWYCMNMERLLDEYPGVWVNRYAITAEEERFEVDNLLLEIQEAEGGEYASLLLPPCMEWYKNRVWKHGYDWKPRGSTKDIPITDSDIPETEMETRFRMLHGSKLEEMFETRQVNSGSGKIVEARRSSLFDRLVFEPEGEDDAPRSPSSPSSPSLILHSPRTSVESSVAMRIVGVQNLRRVRYMGHQSPYCKWRVVDSDGNDVATGQTSKHNGGDGSQPQWGTQTFIWSELAQLRHCDIHFHVKTERGWRLSEEIAIGSMAVPELAEVPSLRRKWQRFSVPLRSKKGVDAGILTFQVRLVSFEEEDVMIPDRTSVKPY